MNNADRLKTIESFLENECFPLLAAKGHDYTQGNADVNDNFKRIARMLAGRGIDKYDVWAIYFFKHVDALTTWLNKRKLESSESLNSRIADLVNYLLILYSMLSEDNKIGCPRTCNTCIFSTFPEGSDSGVCYVYEGNPFIRVRQIRSRHGVPKYMRGGKSKKVSAAP